MLYVMLYVRFVCNDVLDVVCNAVSDVVCSDAFMVVCNVLCNGSM